MRGGDLLEVWREAFGVSPQRRTALRPLPRRDVCVISTLSRFFGGLRGRDAAQRPKRCPGQNPPASYRANTSS
jgi:hypothetical protein